MECEKKEYQLQAVCFAAAVGVLLACLEGTIVKSFLALNLLLLAILFTSTNPTLLCAKSMQKQNNASDHQERLKIAEQCNFDEKNQENFKKVKVVESELMGFVENVEKVIECDKEEEFQLSKEELNEEVEAFIAMFKQHLKSDAKGRSCRQTHISLSKNSGRVNVLPNHFR